MLKADNSVPLLIIFILGIYGIILALSSLNGINYSVFAVLTTVTLFSVILWYTFFNKRKIFYIVSAVTLILCSITLLLKWNTIIKQAIYINDSYYGVTSGDTKITLIAILASVIITYLAFFMEFVLRKHSIMFLVTMILILLGSFIGFHIDIIPVLLMLMFQITFTVANMSEPRSEKNTLSFRNTAKIAGKCGFITAVVILVSVIISYPLTQIYQEDLYNSVTVAEDFIRNMNLWNSASDTDNIENGQISRGNLHQTGEKKLEVTVSSKPNENLYLRGKSYDEYNNGQWTYTGSENNIIYEFIENFYNRLNLQNSFTIYDNSYYYTDSYREMLDFYHLNLANQQGYSLINNMYFNLNLGKDYDSFYSSWLLSNASKTIYIKNVSNGISVLAPYYSQLYMDDIIGINGTVADYGNLYIEQRDINADVSQYQYYKEFEEMYSEEIKYECVQYPSESLQRLKALCDATPLDNKTDYDRDVITTFILYTLNNHAVYDVNPGMAPINKEIAEYFLFDNGKGYCVHFATVAALMYHIYGIPARYVTGYVVEPSAFKLTSDGQYYASVTDESAHSWVEIFIDNYGWTPVEVTPSIDGKISASYPGFDRNDMQEILKSHGWKLRQSVDDIINSVSTSNNGDEEITAKVAFGEYHDLFVISLTTFIFCIVIFPFFLDYRRLRFLKKIDTMNSRKLFTLIMNIMHYGEMLKEYNGTEENFAEEFSKASDISVQNSIKMTNILIQTAYGNTTISKADENFIRTIYKNTSKQIYKNLKFHKKLIFKYIKNFI